MIAEVRTNSACCPDADENDPVKTPIRTAFPN